ncbi:MAG: oligosaccharide flippase family protein [Candidatus Sericytochromatia bacterium]|nr:oligosaccharide flippase family protein [Candidatus Sericytochromatia bacterium]
MSKLRYVHHNFFTIALNAVSGLALTVLAARCLTPAGMGAYSLLFWLMTVASILINLGGVNTTLKHVAEARGRGDELALKGVLAYGLRAWAGRTVVMALGWLAVASSLEALYAQHSFDGALPCALMFIVPFTLFNWLVGACQGMQQYAAVARATLAWASLAVGGTLVVAIVGGHLLALLLVQASAAIFAVSVLLSSLNALYPRWWKENVTPEQKAQLRRYSVPVAGMVILDALIWQRSGVFFLGQWAAPEQVAHYALAFGLSQMLMRAFPGTLVGLLIPSMASAAGAGRMDEIAQVYRSAGRWMALLAIPVGIVSAGAAGNLLEVLYGKNYSPALQPFWVLLFAGAATMIWGFPASSVLYALNGQHRLLAVGAGAAVFYTALAVYLIPLHGALGAAWATAGAQIATLVPGVLCARRCLPGLSQDWKAFGVIGAAGFLLAGVLFLTQWVSSEPGGWLVGSLLGGGGYAFIVWWFGAITPIERQGVGRAVRLRIGCEKTRLRRVTTVTFGTRPRV